MKLLNVTLINFKKSPYELPSIGIQLMGEYLLYLLKNFIISLLINPMAKTLSPPHEIFILIINKQPLWGGNISNLPNRLAYVWTIQKIGPIRFKLRNKDFHQWGETLIGFGLNSNNRTAFTD